MDSGAPTWNDGAASLPAPLEDEVVRGHLVDRLARRWNVRLVAIEAPGGYGKSTAVAQAIRDNAADPSGVDVYVRCRRTHRNVVEVLRSIDDELAGVSSRHSDDLTADELVSSIIDRLAQRSPTATCVWIDDAHLLTDLAEQDGAAGLRDLLDGVPATARLAFVGRRLPPLPMARLVAADECVVIGREELLFDLDERAQLAQQHDRDVAVIEHADGWPALSRLVLMSPSMSRDYLFDEVVSAMSAAQRDAIAIAQISGRVDAELLRACDVDCDLGELAHTVPLVERYADGSVRAHDLWRDADAKVASEERRDELAARVSDHLASLGRLDDALDIAIAEERWALAQTHVISLLIEGDAGLGAAETQAWFDAFPPEWQQRPGIRLLHATSAALADGPSAGIEEAHAAAAEFRAAGDETGLCAALSDLGTRAWAIGDASIVEPYFDSILELVAAGAPRILELVTRQEAVTALFEGDVRRSIDLHAQLPTGEISLRHQASLELVLGNGERSRRLGAELVERFPSDYNRRALALYEFTDGDPTAVLHPDFPSIGVVDRQRDLQYQVVVDAVLAVHRGLPVDAGSIRALDTASRSMERFFQLIGLVCVAIADHDDDLAARLLLDGLAEIDPDDPLVPIERRRFLPMMYLLSEDARAVLETDELHGHQIVQRDLSRTLHTLRHDPNMSVGPLPAAPALVSHLPLPWSIELLCLLAARDDPRAEVLLDGLAELVGAATQRELRHQTTRSGPWKRGAAALLAAVPVPPSTPAHVTLFGAPTVRHGEQVDPIGRSRVVQLLTLLVLRRRVPRDALAELIWPGDDAAKVANRFRVALSQMRSALDPDRSTKEASFRLRDLSGVLHLVESEWMTCDVWELEHLLGGPATEASTAAAIAIIERGVHDDLREIVEISTGLDDLVERAVAARCSVGEQLLADGRAADAIDLAESLVRTAPLSERAGALRIAAYLATGDEAAARTAIDDVLALASELDVDPDPATAMLIRRYERRTGDSVVGE